MKRIKIKRGGCGITYKDENGVLRHALKTAEHEPFFCDDAQASRLVRLGVAEIVGEAEGETRKRSEGSEEGKLQPEERIAVEETAGDSDDRPYYSVGSDVKELRKIAKDVGVTLKVGMSKRDMVKALDAYFDEQMPDLTAAPPVK